MRYQTACIPYMNICVLGLGVVDFHPSADAAIIFVSEADLLSGIYSIRLSHINLI